MSAVHLMAFVLNPRRSKFFADLDLDYADAGPARGETEEAFASRCLARRRVPAAELAALGGLTEVNQRLAALGQAPVEPAEGEP